MTDKFENMTTEELLRAVCENYKESGAQPRKLKTAPNGAIILDANNKHDREWYENDEDYSL